MAIRIKPREIDIPEDDPFKNDLLGRKEPVEILTHLIGSLEGPTVLSVDAEWGNGKTTFLNIWGQHLRNQKFPVVIFNAWETDFSGDPFLALSERISNGLESYPDAAVRQKIIKTREIAIEVLRRVVPGAIRFATAGLLDVDPLFEKELGQALATAAKDRLAAYEQAQKSFGEFRDSLEDMAEALSKDNRPLVVMIDELDRCRPSYAVELLEVAKHFFSVDHIVFVLAVNRSELAHSVRALYGAGFDAKGYLDRFFDIDFKLPRPERSAFVANLIISTHIGQLPKTEQEAVQALLESFFGTPGLSLRKIAQATHHLGLVWATLPSEDAPSLFGPALALILKTFLPESYYRFCAGEIRDIELVRELYEQPGIRALHEKIRAHVEALIIVANCEILGTWDFIGVNPSLSELGTKYETAVGHPNGGEMLYENDVLDQVARCWNGRISLDFLESVRRIELLSPQLIRNHNPKPLQNVNDP